MQVRQQKDPIFQLISEQGQNRHKEFTVTVQCMGLKEQGIGPNKKLAKRAAAEAMLARIGYVKVFMTYQNLLKSLKFLAYATAWEKFVKKEARSGQYEFHGNWPF